jgi:UDP-N-acetylmuramoyl-tripeptide--D-alanyl-D-alanine ligase
MEEKTRAQVFFYGLSSEADLWADNVEGQGLEGIRFRLHYRRETLYVRVPLIGRHSVHTALRAAAVGLVEGLTWQEIFDGLNQGHTQLRLGCAQQTGALILDDTYNASPELLAALNLLDELMANIAVDMLELAKRQGHEMRVARRPGGGPARWSRACAIAEAARRSNEKIIVLNSKNRPDRNRPPTFDKERSCIDQRHTVATERIINALEVRP